MTGSKWMLLAGLTVAVAVAALVWYSAAPRPVAFQGLAVEPPEPAPDFTLTDQHGQPFRLASRPADATLLFFGYTFCPDVCPTTLAELRGVRKTLGQDGDRMQVLFVTVDPERDTPQRLRQYLEPFGDGVVGLTGTPDEIAAVAQGFGAVARKETAAGSGVGYLVSHSSLVFLIDRDQRLRVRLPAGIGAESLLHDVAAVLAQPPARAGRAPAAAAAAAAPAAAAAAAAAPAVAAALRVEEAWARPVTAMAGATGAIYLTVVNGGTAADTLVGVRTEVAAAAELHETRLENAIMHMHPAGQVAVPAGGRAELLPRGLHVMLIDVKRTLAPGDRFRATLIFAGAGELPVEVTVREP